MSRRIFVEVERGMTDKTVVCVFPWEMRILELVHGGAVKELSIDDMASLKDAAKVERVKTKHSEVVPPSLREQFEIMAYVDPDEDPAKDPAAEYERLANKYGMDKELPIACVARVFGEFSSGAFGRLLEEHADDHAKRPAALKARDEGEGKSPSQMSIGELRTALSERSIEWKPTMNKATLVQMLEDNLAPV